MENFEFSEIKKIFSSSQINPSAQFRDAISGKIELARRARETRDIAWPAGIFSFAAAACLAVLITFSAKVASAQTRGTPPILKSLAAATFFPSGRKTRGLNFISLYHCADALDECICAAAHCPTAGADGNCPHQNQRREDK